MKTTGEEMRKKVIKIILANQVENKLRFQKAIKVEDDQLMKVELEAHWHDINVVYEILLGQIKNIA